MSVYTAVITAMLTNILVFVAGLSFCVYGVKNVDKRKCRDCKYRRENDE